MIGLAGLRQRFAQLPDSLNEGEVQAPGVQPQVMQSSESPAPIQQPVQVQAPAFESPTIEQTLEQRAEQLRAEAEQAQSKVEDLKWPAFQEELARAAQLKAELAQVESRLASHADEIAARARAEEAARNRQRNIEAMVDTAHAQEHRLTKIVAGLRTASHTSQTLREVLTDVLQNIVAHQQASEKYNSYASATPGADSEVRQIAGSAALSAVQTHLETGFDKRGYHPGPLTQGPLAALKDIDPLTWQLIQVLLSDFESQKLIQAKAGKSSDLNAWLPGVNRAQGSGGMLIITE